MKSSDALKAFRHLLNGERSDGVSVLRQIEAAEYRAGRVGVASQLRHMLEHQGHTAHLIELPKAPPRLTVYSTERRLDTVILPAAQQLEVERFIREWKGRHKLAAYGLPVRKAVLLSGPSGNGKTTLAHAIATSLGMPLAAMRFDQVIDSHVGTSLKNLAKSLDFAASSPMVLLIDEADSLFSARFSVKDAADNEHNRTVNHLLTTMDSWGSNSLLVFATNMGDQIDPALRRRIGLHLEIGPPDAESIARMVSLLHKTYSVLLSCDWQAGIERAENLASVEEQALAAAREFVLGLPEEGESAA